MPQFGGLLAKDLSRGGVREVIDGLQDGGMSARQDSSINTWALFDHHDDGCYDHLFERPKDDLEIFEKMEADLMAA